MNQYYNYQMSNEGNAAYNAFLASLLMEYTHDQIADNLTSQYNVTWSCTNLIVVAVGEDVNGTFY